MAEAARRLEVAYQEALAAGAIGPGGGMAGTWVFLGRFVGPDGTRDTILLCDPEADLPDVLGLLDVGQVNWRQATLEWVRGKPE